MTVSIAYDDTSFQKYLNWSHQTEILGNEILALIKPSYKSLLDVGAGNGDLTKYYIDLFEKALLLEPTQLFYERLMERFPDATVVKIRVEDFRRDGSYNDFIVASHVLYYVPNPIETITNLLSYLNEGGRFVIVMVDRNSNYRRFVDYFYNIITENKNDLMEIEWSEIVTCRATQGMHIEMRDVPMSVKAPSIDEFLSMNEFIFNVDVCHLPNAVIDEMRTYLRDFFTADGLTIDAGNKVIVIEK